MRLLSVSALNIKNVRRIKLDSDNTLLFDYLEYIKTNRWETTKSVDGV